MKRFIVLLVLVAACLTQNSWAGTEDTIVGRWLYFMKVYQGQEMPEGPDATLRLFFEFNAKGESQLYWHHVGEHDHCARRGHFVYQDGMLVDTVDWVDPNNTYGCNQDPDMQLGKVSRTPVSFRNGNLHMRLQLGDEELYYVWKRVTEEVK